MTRKLSISLLAVLAACATTAVFAVEALTTEELISHGTLCREDPEGVAGIFCVRYNQEFIDEAVATDERVSVNVASEYDREETLTAHATRTRLGSRMDRFGTSHYAEFSLGDPLPLVEVARTVMKDSVNIKSVEGRELARDVLYATLRGAYACGPDNE